jgi:hypothetical protein
MVVETALVATPAVREFPDHAGEVSGRRQQSRTKE